MYRDPFFPSPNPLFLFLVSQLIVAQPTHPRRMNNEARLLYSSVSMRRGEPSIRIFISPFEIGQQGMNGLLKCEGCFLLLLLRRHHRKARIPFSGNLITFAPRPPGRAMNANELKALFSTKRLFSFSEFTINFLL